MYVDIYSITYMCTMISPSLSTNTNSEKKLNDTCIYCVYVWIYVFIYLYLHIFMCMLILNDTYVNILCLYINICIDVICSASLCTNTDCEEFVEQHLHILYINVYVYVDICIPLHIHVYIYMYIYVHVIFTYIYIYKTHV